MKQNYLRGWLKAVLVSLVVYMIYSATGSLLIRLANAVGADIEQVRLIYRYAGVVIYCAVPVCMVAIGRLLTGSEGGDTRLSKTAGALFMADGTISLLWQVLVLAMLIMGKSFVQPSIMVAQIVISGLLSGAALILISLYYGDRKMLGWAIAFAVFEIGFVTAFSIYQFTGSRTAAAVFALFSMGVVVCKLVYYIKWIKRLKPQNV